MKELSKKFDFNTVDAKWADYWVKEHVSHAEPHAEKKSYTIVIPPPNVTGILHMGHALNNTLQDIIIRYKRMKGFEACWMPGTDHAGIATQNVVEKQLAKEGKTRHDLGRERFLERLWDWKKEYGSTIIHQLEKLGASCDWERTRFTMDEEYSEAVKTVFIKLFEKGLIYQGSYIVNWCPRCHTALSDEEAEHQEKKGTLTHIRYPLKDNPSEFITVATTRPETMLGDTAVAVNPKDKRYKKLIGKAVILPLMNREIPIISDEFVDEKFGTGAVKVTPAHDPNDFEMGKRHNLAFINVLTPNGEVNEQGGAFKGLDRFEARKKIIETLKEQNLLEKIEDHTHAVGHCYRCSTIVEPYLSKQWFVKMKPLAEPALKAVVDGKIKFYPDRWTKVYTNWMENIRDWCISRQIWWGHRIPVWYDEGGTAFVAHNEKEAHEQARKKHGKDVKLTQDPDVMDTWFSSWLWPFATFGWPKDNKDLQYFYPGNALFTASEIIFFWVARMIMAGIEFMGDIPFSEVYIHGTVRDAKGRKMSKSLGNALDPLEIIKEYGADALRFSLIINSGQDLFISKEKFEIGRNFANKLWNATRLILMNVNNPDLSFDFKNIKNFDELDLPTKWIISKCFSTIEKIEQSIESYRYSEAESLVYDFFWGNFCDWYLEIIKDRWDDKNVQKVTVKILELSLKMMHPFMPFVTEEIWDHISGEGSISRQPWPEVSKKFIDKSVEEDMQFIIDIISSVRNTRADWNIPYSHQTICLAESKDKKEKLILNQQNQNIIKNICRLHDFSFNPAKEKPKQFAALVVGKTEMIIPLGDLMDLDKEKQKKLDEIKKTKAAYEQLSARLNNQGFLDKAPQEIIEKEKQRLVEMDSRIKQLEKILTSIK